MFSIEGKKAFVTGGGSGIGLAICKRFIAAGATVIMADISDCQSIADEIGATFVQLDVASEASFAKAMQSVNEQHGKIDVLINNAGIGDLPGPIGEGTIAAWKRILDINVLGVMNGIKYGAAQLYDGGCIINTSSQSAVTKVAGMEPYSASKSAVISITQTAALELEDRKISVNAVCPSNTRTPMMASAEDAEYAEIMSQEFSPAHRVAETDDLVGVFHFLASKEAAFVNGQAIVVDGGWTAGITGRLLENVLTK